MQRLNAIGSGSMGILTADMKRVVDEQRLGFVATVCPDGTPNLSPKGTTAVWDDDHLVFANIRSPGSLPSTGQAGRSTPFGKSCSSGFKRRSPSIHRPTISD
jgi:hypothetical protein